MRAMCAVVLASILPAPAAHAAGPKIREQQIQFERGEARATLKGTIQGDETVDYKLCAAAGQSMVVHFKAKNASAYFNVLPPGSDEALFVGSSSGNRFEGTPPAGGDYTIRVYLMRNAARRNESTTYTLEVSVTGAVP